MANSASARKRNRQNHVRRERNRGRKSALKSQVRKLNDEIHDGEFASAKQTYSDLQKQLDQLAAKRTVHPKTAARRKSRLARRLNKAANAK